LGEASLNAFLEPSVGQALRRALACNGDHPFNMAFTLGIDYGTNPVRALLAEDVSNGRQLTTCVVNYPGGKQGILLDSRDAPLPPFPPVPFGTWSFYYALHRH
jgi:hypothetical protein